VSGNTVSGTTVSGAWGITVSTGAVIGGAASVSTLGTSTRSPRNRRRMSCCLQRIRPGRCTGLEVRGNGSVAARAAPCSVVNLAADRLK
jgi:hypothetical protein